MRAEYPNQLDYSGVVLIRKKTHRDIRTCARIHVITHVHMYQEVSEKSVQIHMSSMLLNLLVYQCLPSACCQRGYGATAAHLTPDQNVGSSNLSAPFVRVHHTPHWTPRLWPVCGCTGRSTLVFAAAASTKQVSLRLHGCRCIHQRSGAVVTVLGS